MGDAWRGVGWVMQGMGCRMGDAGRGVGWVMHGGV